MEECVLGKRKGVKSEEGVYALSLVPPMLYLYHLDPSRLDPDLHNSFLHTLEYIFYVTTSFVSPRLVQCAV